jgi:tryptophan synthase alpha chain
MNGATLDAVIGMVSRVAPTLKAPLVLFTYYNPILRKGVDKFCAAIKAAGASGLLVPDIPLEETGAVREACGRAGLELVLLCTPTTPKARMADIARASQGFVYLVSVTGVTGVQERVQSRVQGLIESLHSVTDKPIAVGFGVSKPEQARQIVEWGAEGVICGSALVRALGEASTPEEGLAAMEALAKDLRGAIPH